MSPNHVIYNHKILAKSVAAFEGINISFGLSVTNIARDCAKE